MREYIIRRTDGEWFDLHATQFAEVLRPNTFPSKLVKGWGDHRIEVDGFELAFSFEDPGIQVIFEGEMPEKKCRQIVEEILAKVEQATGQKGRIVDL